MGARRNLGKGGHDALKCFPDRARVMHESDAHVVLTGVQPVRARLCQECTRHNLHTTAFPKGYRGFFTSAELADIEPQEEAASRPAVSVPTLQQFVANIEFGAIGLPDRSNVLLLRPDRRGSMLDDPR